MPIERLSRMFRVFGSTQCRGRSDVYAALSESVAADDQLLELTSVAPPEQRRPSLLFAAVNFLLARNPDAELRRYYPIHGGTRKVDSSLSASFADFCRRHRTELAQLLATRSTQTNEIRRCFALRLGQHEVARHWPGPVHLLEIGASAGLNLIFDHYAYRTDGRPLPGGTESSVVVTTTHRGTGQSWSWPDRPAVVRQRIGLDQHPVELDDAQARSWLEAFIWPERVDDLTTLRNAIEAFRTTDADVRLVRGDAVTDTAAMIDELPGDEPIIVFTASLLSYLEPDQRAAFDDQLAAAAERRRIGWVFAEAPGLLARSGIEAAGLSGPLSSAVINYAVGVSLRSAETRHDEVLALAEPYLRWIAPAKERDDDFAWASDLNAP